MIKSWMMINPASKIEATGGTISYDGNYTIHTFYSSGNFEVTKLSKDALVECLVVAGGGGGGGTIAGGGGGGGLIYNSSFEVTLQTYSVVVGDGGVGALGYNSAGQTGGNGGNSSFGGLVAIGGGGGAGWSGYPPTSGGSGGGGSEGGYSGGTGSQGYDGGTYQLDHGGGGGGAGGVGGSGTGASDSVGGIGLAYSISGTSTYYAGGGGGGVRDTTGHEGGAGGLGGGGQGEDTSTKNINADGTDNLGGGGGGAGYDGANPTVRIGGAGGKGIVIIRYLTNNIIDTISYDNLVLYFDASNTDSYPGTGTTWTDLSGNDNHGTLTGNAVYNSANGGVIVLDGIDDWIAVTNGGDFDFGTGDYAICMWVYFSGYTGTYQTLIDTYPGAGNGFIFTTMNNTTQIISYYTPSAVGGFDWNSSSASMTVGWNYLVATRVSGLHKIYKNGVEIFSLADGANITGGDLMIGRGLDDTYGDINGKIAHLTIYKGRSFSEMEVNANFDNLKSTFGF